MWIYFNNNNMYYTGWAKSRYTVILHYILYLFLAHLVYYIKYTMYNLYIICYV